MFNYILYITPLSETSSELCDKIKSYTGQTLSTEIYSDTSSGICIGVICENEIDIERVVWEVLQEGVIPHGNYWSVHIGYTSLINKKFLEEKYVNTISYSTPEQEETEIVDKSNTKYVLSKNSKDNSIPSERVWRFL